MISAGAALAPRRHFLRMHPPSGRMTSPLRPLVWAALVAGSFGLAGCSSIDDQGPLRWLTPYRMEVVQGNVVTSEMAAQLREGQTREQVRMLLGSPLLTDLFHADRWDYVFAIRRQGAPSQQRRLTVFFNADRVQRFQAADLPDEKRPSWPRSKWTNPAPAALRWCWTRPLCAPCRCPHRGPRQRPLPPPLLPAPRCSATTRPLNPDPTCSDCSLDDRP
jgi:outer membrane protein assembly factor BamE (lipoprotein component of BamABCDE complex)